jgi:hypothetical protein
LGKDSLLRRLKLKWEHGLRHIKVRVVLLSHDSVNSDWKAMLYNCKMEDKF